MPLTYEEICEMIDCTCPSPIDKDTYERSLLGLLCNLNSAIVAAPTVVTTPHTFSTGSTSPVPAGTYTVTIQVTSGPSVVNGISVATGGSITLTANNGKTLPAIVITGGTYVWGAII